MVSEVVKIIIIIIILVILISFAILFSTFIKDSVLNILNQLFK
ncbi:MAG: hypothetical protein QW197_01935 [Candidatus Aenigmatarchaeota archaeon]